MQCNKVEFPPFFMQARARPVLDHRGSPDAEPVRRRPRLGHGRLQAGTAQFNATLKLD